MRLLNIIILCISIHSMALEPGKNLIHSLSFPVEKYVLSNGMTVLLHKDSSVPLVSYQTWFRVGSRNEEEGITGLAHMFEHMMFKGTKKYPSKDFHRTIQSSGMNYNAFTYFDYTGYYENLPSSKLETIMDIESDRMRNLIIDEKNLESERQVVLEERRVRTENSPMGQAFLAMYSTAYKVHPYRWPIIGWREDIENYTVEKLKNFYEKWYQPNNAILVIAGDIDIGETKALVKKYYSSISRKEIKLQEIPQEPEQTGQRNAKIYKNIKGPIVTMSFVTTTGMQKEDYALSLLASILGDGSSSRLHQRLVYREQVATSVSAYNLSKIDKGMFSVIVECKPGVDVEKVKASVFAELWKLRKTKVSEAEILKAQNLAARDFVDGMKTISGKARNIALYETVTGNYQNLFKELSKLYVWEPESLQKVAQNYLKPEQRNVVEILPKRSQ